MLLNVISAEYIEDYKIKIEFDNRQVRIADLKNSIFKDTREIFFPLRDINYFKDFFIRFNTITWKNEADFAPEFLLELGNEISY